MTSVPSLLALLLASLGPLQDAADEAPPRDAGLWFAYQREIALEDLVTTCANVFDLPLEFEPGSLDGVVSIRSGPGLTTPELWALTNRHLAKAELACVQAPGERALSIVPLAEAASRARLELQGLDEARAGYVKVLRDLERADPADVAESVRSLLAAEGSQVNALPATAQVVLAGLAPQVAEALEVVAALDAAPAGSTVKSVRAKHLSPTALATLVDRVRKAQALAGDPAPQGSLLANPNTESVVIVAPRDEVDSWAALIEAFDEAETVVTDHYSPVRFGLEETARLIREAVFAKGAAQGEGGGKVVKDDLTGTLIVTASWSQHAEIGELLERLEDTPPESRRAMRSFPVKHRDVQQLLSVLGELLDEGGLFESPAPPREGERPPPPEGVGGALPIEAASRVVSGSGASGFDVTLTQDPGTNRIVAVGPPRVLDQVGELIVQLDVQNPQVLVEALIVSLTEAETLDLGVELQKGFRSGSTLWRLQSLFGLGSPDPGLASIPQAAGAGGTAVVLDPGDFSGVVRALATVNDGRTLTIPKVLVNNNEQANLNSILQTPYTTTSLSTSTTITSFGGTLDAGTTVTVRPQITEGNKLMLDYTVSLSSFVGESADPSVPPPRQQTSLASVATVPDGYAVILGGLEMENEGTSSSRVPWLGDVPLFGHLFRNESDSSSRSRFYVFLRCSVMRSPLFEELKYVSRRDIDMAGIETGAPEVRPLVMR